MGLAFLPWERLPAYLLGAVFCAVSGLSLAAGERPSVLQWALGLGSITFGVWLIWSRYKTGEEPLWSEVRRAAARRRTGTG